jgi:hypothetical protein
VEVAISHIRTKHQRKSHTGYEFAKACLSLTYRRHLSFRERVEFVADILPWRASIICIARRASQGGSCLTRWIKKACEPC